jgi:hypothetical protein
MFTKKQTNLFPKSPATAKADNKVVPMFVNAGLQKAAITTSGNGAQKLSTTLDPFVDQFGTLGNFKAPRKFSDICRDCEILWAQEQLNAVKFTGFIRTIPRKVNLFDGSQTQEPQKGAELKYEAIMRMIWLQINHPETFWKNVGLFVSLGSWHDIFSMLQYDLVYNGWDNKVLNWNKFGDLILSGLENPKVSDLIKKYLPQIKARSACKTVEAEANCMIAKWICSRLFGNKITPTQYKQYRNLKTSGNAHSWQKLISNRQFDRIDFNSIHGRALSILTKGKFLKNHNLVEKYTQWISSPTEKGVKYTGFVHELFHNLNHFTQQHVKLTIDEQFKTLVEKAKSEKNEKSCNYIVVRDTSGSMGGNAIGTSMTCDGIAKSLALYFSEFLKGKFANSFIEFSDTAKMHTWKGSTPVEKWLNDNCEAYGSTNFESVLHLFASILKTGVPESEFPTGILCISDGEFNPSTLAPTNVQSAKQILKNAGFSKQYVDSFRIVLWNLQSRFYGPSTGSKFETFATEIGTYYFSGYSASIIDFLNTDKIQTPRDVFDAAMDQEILNRMVV